MSAFTPQCFFVGVCLLFVPCVTSLHRGVFSLLHVFSILVKIRWETWCKNKLTCDLQLMVQLTVETDMSSHTN